LVNLISKIELWRLEIASNQTSPKRKKDLDFSKSLFSFQFFGGTSGGRTHDKRIKSPLLYQLSYGPITLSTNRALRSLKL
jgi:hypothetical protein